MGWDLKGWKWVLLKTQMIFWFPFGHIWIHPCKQIANLFWEKQFRIPLSYINIQDPSLEMRQGRQCRAKIHSKKTISIRDKMVHLSILFFLVAGLRLEMRMKLALSFPWDSEELGSCRFHAEYFHWEQVRWILQMHLEVLSPGVLIAGIWF